MNFDDDYCPEPWGPIYVRPASTPCPNCPCCSAALCEKALADPWEGLRDCATHAARADWDIVKGCPCAPVKKGA